MGDPIDRLRCLGGELPIKSRDWHRRHPDNPGGYASPQPFLGSQMMDFPQQLPYAAIQTLVSALRGGAHDAAALASAGYEVLGFLLGLWLHSGSPPQPPLMGEVMGEALATGTDREQQAQHLEQFAQQFQGQQADFSRVGAGFHMPAWLMPLVLQILQQVLAGQLGQPA